MNCCPDQPKFPFTFSHENSKFPPNFCKRRGESNKLNPGSIHNLHEMARNIMPNWIDGVELRGRRILNGNSTIFASWVLGHAQPTGFRCGGSMQQSITEHILKTPAIEADINPSTFATNLRCLHHPMPQLGLELCVQVMPWAVKNSLITAEYIGPSYTVSCSMHDPRRQNGRVTVSTLYNILPRFSVGGEYLIEWYQGNARTQFAFAVRYMNAVNAVAATVSRNALDMTFWSKLNDSVQVGSAFVVNKNRLNRVAEVFYQWEKGDVVVRGKADTNFTFGFTYTKVMRQISAAFGLSLVYCQPANKLICGFKLDLDSSYA